MGSCKVLTRTSPISPRPVRWRYRDQAGLKSILSPLNIHKHGRPWSQDRHFRAMFGNRDESAVVPENSFLVAIHLNFETPVPGIYMCNQSMACRSFNRGYRCRSGRHNRGPVAVAGLSQVDTHGGSRCGKDYGQCYKLSHRNIREASAAPVALAKSAFPHILWHRPTALGISLPGRLLPGEADLHLAHFCLSRSSCNEWKLFSTGSPRIGVHLGRGRFEKADVQLEFFGDLHAP